MVYKFHAAYAGVFVMLVGEECIYCYWIIQVYAVFLHHHYEHAKDLPCIDQHDRQ